MTATGEFKVNKKGQKYYVILDGMHGKAQIPYNKLRQGLRSAADVKQGEKFRLRFFKLNPANHPDWETVK